MTPPAPEQQVQFLVNLQRLLAEGQFTASYKFALLHALADHLAAEEHLASWVARNRDRDDLAGAFDAAEIVHDLAVSERVCTWAYQRLEMAGGQVWVEKGVLRGISSAWMDLATA